MTMALADDDDDDFSVLNVSGQCQTVLMLKMMLTMMTATML